MKRKQVKDVRRKVNDVLSSEMFKDSACAKNKSVIMQDIIKDMNADNVRIVTNAVVMQYFYPVYFDRELYLQKKIQIKSGVSTQEPKSMPETAKSIEDMVRECAYRIGKMWNTESLVANG